MWIVTLWNWEGRQTESPKREASLGQSRGGRWKLRGVYLSRWRFLFRNQNFRAGRKFGDHLILCFSRCGLGCQISSPTPDLLSQNLHFNKIPRWFFCKLYAEKQMTFPWFLKLRFWDFQEVKWYVKGHLGNSVAETEPETVFWPLFLYVFIISTLSSYSPYLVHIIRFPTSISFSVLVIFRGYGVFIY